MRPFSGFEIPTPDELNPNKPFPLFTKISSLFKLGEVKLKN